MQPGANPALGEKKTRACSRRLLLDVPLLMLLSLEPTGAGSGHGHGGQRPVFSPAFRCNQNDSIGQPIFVYITAARIGAVHAADTAKKDNGRGHLDKQKHSAGNLPPDKQKKIRPVGDAVGQVKEREKNA